MKDNLKRVENWDKVPPMLQNTKIQAIRIDKSCPVRYGIYDLEEKSCIGTCEVWYKKKDSKKIPVLIGVDSSAFEFLEILEVANRVICE